MVNPSPKQRAVDLKQQLNAQLTPIQKQDLVQIIIALDQAEQLLYELQQADGIIHNAINTMTEQQRIKLAWFNYQDNLSAQWAFRKQDRKQAIERGQRILGICKGKQIKHHNLLLC